MTAAFSLRHLFRRDARRWRPRVALWYGSAAMASRHPQFYGAYAVADTFDGRFDVLVLHIALLLEVLKQAGGPEEVLCLMMEAFVEDMDRALRDSGVADVAMARYMKRVVLAFYGRLEAYGAAVTSEQVRTVLVRNVYRGVDPGEAAHCLTSYVGKARARGKAISPAGMFHLDQGEGLEFMWMEHVQ